MREINSLCHTLPLIATNTSSGDIICSEGLSSSNGEELFKGEFVQQYNEVALLSFLGTVMKGCNTMNQVSLSPKSTIATTKVFSCKYCAGSNYPDNA